MELTDNRDDDTVLGSPDPELARPKKRRKKTGPGDGPIPMPTWVIGARISRAVKAATGMVARAT